MAGLPPGMADRPAGAAEAGGTARPPSGMTDRSGLLDPDGVLRETVGDCVHCGFCLPACPTYQLWGEEMDSPRGRIHLIGQLLDGAIASPAAASHIDRCLGCMACLTACPSGVRYDRLIGAARSWAADEGRAGASGADADGRTERPDPSPLPARSARDRMVRALIFATFPYPARLRLLTGPLRAAQWTGLDRLISRSAVADRLPAEFASALRMAPRLDLLGLGAARGVPPRGEPGHSEPGHSRLERRMPVRGRPRPARRVGRPPERIPARGSRRAVVGMLTGCVQQVFFPTVNIATARVLAAEGCDVVIPAGQGCCGALSMHDGRRAEAARFARTLISTFEQAGVDAIVVNSAGCGSAMKEYSDLLAEDSQWSDRAATFAGQVADFSEFLARLGPEAVRHPLPLTVAYHDACHLAHAQRITTAPRDLLRAIPGLRLAEIPDAGTCCGSAGIYNLVQAEAATELGERKAAAVRETGADLLVSGNPGCTLQIGAALAADGCSLPVTHLAQVIDASIRAVPASTLLGRSVADVS